jgi:hypothetical protein
VDHLFEGGPLGTVTPFSLIQVVLPVTPVVAFEIGQLTGFANPLQPVLGAAVSMEFGGALDLAAFRTTLRHTQLSICVQTFVFKSEDPGQVVRI